MKKVLITGANSYIGMSFENYITENYPEHYEVDTVDMIDGTWRKKSFVGYDSVFHVAGIAHQKETKETSNLYYEINRDLAFSVAQKAKHDGVKQFVFFSSMSVYGMDTGVVTSETVPNPKNNYGKSKLQAEKQIVPLADEDFKVAVLRPPMVYGAGCKGNYQTIVKLVKKLPVFPYVKNRRSMIHVNKLVCFVKEIIDTNTSGLFFPQDDAYIQTSAMAQDIAKSIHKKLYLSRFLGACVLVMIPFSKMVRKAFGSLIYVRQEKQ